MFHGTSCRLLWNERKKTRQLKSSLLQKNMMLQRLSCERQSQAKPNIGPNQCHSLLAIVINKKDDIHYSDI